ncbi:hypothetical protein B0H10DRAFT_1961558 [Mycena sp. CBHHK59/15]|nr:hypothetical protein B0H10DRAFT_1961558 [Mycena sp. CBHHK59/15]
MSNCYTFVALCVLFALNEKQLVGAAAQLDPRQDSSPSSISASSSTSLLQSSSAATAISSTAASSATALPMYTSSNRALPGRDIILSSSNTDAEVWEQTCNTSLTSVSFNLGLFPFSACQSIFDVLHNLTEYQYYNTSKFYQVNPEVKLLFFGVQNPPTNFNEQINPGCKNLRDQTMALFKTLMEYVLDPQVSKVQCKVCAAGVPEVRRIWMAPKSAMKHLGSEDHKKALDLLEDLRQRREELDKERCAESAAKDLRALAFAAPSDVQGPVQMASSSGVSLAEKEVWADYAMNGAEFDAGDDAEDDHARHERLREEARTFGLWNPDKVARQLGLGDEDVAAEILEEDEEE